MSLESERKRWEEETLKPVTDRFPETKIPFPDDVRDPTVPSGFSNK